MTAGVRILFVGLGQMGLPIARRLRAAGAAVVGLDQNRDAIKVFAGGATSDDRATASYADILITMLPDDRVVRAALLGEQDLAARLKPGGLVIDMSSASPKATRQTAQTLATRGLRLVDAPVSGGVARAEKGDLAIMLGGAAVDAREAQLALAPLARSIIHAGPVGAGHAAKALNNFVSASALVATCEALIVAERFGIAPETMTDILNGSSGKTNTSEAKLKPFILSGTYGSGFALSLMVKDLGIASDLAVQMGVDVADFAAAERLWHAADVVLGPGADHTEMHRYLQEAIEVLNDSTSSKKISTREEDMGHIDMAAFEAAARNDPEFKRETRYLTGHIKLGLGENEYTLSFTDGTLDGVSAPGKPDSDCHIVVRGTSDHWANMLAEKPKPFYQSLQSTAVKHGLSISDTALTFAYLPALNRMMTLMRNIANGRD